MDPVLQRETPKAEKSGITHNATHTTQSHLPMASIDNADERLLARIGYKQVCLASSIKDTRYLLKVTRNFGGSSLEGQPSHMLYPSWAYSDLSQPRMVYPLVSVVRLRRCGRGL